MQSSSYYPPRARWYSRSLPLTRGLPRWLALNRIHLPRGVAFGRLVCGILVPGFGFGARMPRAWATALSGFCFLLLLVFFIWLGRPLGNMAFTLLLSIHATGLGCLLEPWLKGSRLRFRIFVSMAVFFALGGLLYMPVRNLIQDHWLLPLQIQGRTVIVHKLGSYKRMKPGDWLAYSYAGNYDAGVVVRGGIGLSRVVARSGDVVVFTSTSCEVNGVAGPRLGFMPASGNLVVPEKHWFVWPETDINGHGYVPGDAISTALLQIGTIPEEHCLGVPFKHWFWWNNVPK